MINKEERSSLVYRYTFPSFEQLKNKPIPSNDFLISKETVPVKIHVDYNIRLSFTKWTMF